MRTMKQSILLIVLMTAVGTSFADEEKFTLFLKDSGWCWYQDPRAIMNTDNVVVGGVSKDGSIVAGVYDLEEKKVLGRVVLKERLERDDHAAPVFFSRPDGSILTVYAKHNARIHYSRVADKDDYLKWSDEQVLDHGANVSYMNLYAMEDEGKLYNFYRGLKWNPTFITSSDNGKTWDGKPTHFIASEFRGRPYARYIGNGKDTVHLSFTDAHPRDFGNSVYYAAFRGGKFYRANGEAIKDLKKDGPLRPSEAEKVIQGGGGKGRGRSQSAFNSGWNSSIVVDKKGHPHLGNTLYISNTDHRYRIASWNGQKWIEREVAYGGKCLYNRESSYTGLITLDPVDPTIVVISTDVDPTTGKDLGGTHEIYRAKVGLSDDIETIKWEAVTKDTPKGVRNIRPVILSDKDRRVILWQRGDFKTYTGYTLDTVGIIERKANK